MTEDNRMSTVNKLVWRAVAIFGLVFTGIFVAGGFSEWLVANGVEWISVSNVGGIITGLWIMLSAGIAELLTDRIFRKMGKKE